MYQVNTNFGSYNLSLMPNTDDLIKYYHYARKSGIEINAIKFEIRELAKPVTTSITRILKDIAA